MVGPLPIMLLSFLTFSENIGSYNIVSQVIRTEVIVTSKSTFLGGENNKLSNSITTTTKSILNDSKIFSNNEDLKYRNPDANAEINSTDKLKNTAQNVSNILKNKYDQLNSSKSRSGNSNSKAEPVQVENIDIIPITLKNVTVQLPKEPQHSTISLKQQPEKPAKPAEANLGNPNMTLVDRSAFIGDSCAMGLVKVNGKCVEEYNK